MNAQEIRSIVKVCMFDQYGTVVDMQGGLVEVGDAVLAGERLAGQPKLLCDLVAADAFRELDDRRAAAPGTHAVSRDR